MRYYKIIKEGYLIAIGTGFVGGEEISQAEYNELYAIIANTPTAPEGYIYRITADGEYELIEAPTPEPAEDEELTDEEALAIITGGVSV